MLRNILACLMLTVCPLMMAGTIDVEYTQGTQVEVVSLLETSKNANEIIALFEDLNPESCIDNIYLVVSDEDGTVNSLVIIARPKESNVLSKGIGGSKIDTIDIFP